MRKHSPTPTPRSGPPRSCPPVPHRAPRPASTRAHGPGKQLLQHLPTRTWENYGKNQKTERRPGGPAALTELKAIPTRSAASGHGRYLEPSRWPGRKNNRTVISPYQLVSRTIRRGRARASSRGVASPRSRRGAAPPPVPAPAHERSRPLQASGTRSRTTPSPGPALATRRSQRAPAVPSAAPPTRGNMHTVTTDSSASAEAESWSQLLAGPLPGGVTGSKRPSLNVRQRRT